MNIYTVGTFYNSILGMTREEIYEIINDKVNAYDSFELPKKNGTREISAINKENDLYILQKKLYMNFFSKIKLAKCAKGFVKGYSYRSFLEPHLGNKYFIRMDIKNFFGTINSEMIRESFEGYINVEAATDKLDILDIICEICTLGDILPQGAVTSPVLSNIVFTRIDQRILKYCQVFEVSYTRYADDLLFSSKDFDMKSKKWFLRKLRYILSSSGYNINFSKTKYAEDEIALNGFVVGEFIRLSRKRLKDILTVLHFCEQSENEPSLHDVDTYLGKINSVILLYRKKYENKSFISIDNFIQYLAGYRAYMIAWLDHHNNESSQKKLIRIINRIENIISKLDKVYLCHIR